MRYRVKHSKKDGFTVYKYIHYTPGQRGLRGVLATTCAAVSAILLLPIPDEIIIVPAIATGLQAITSASFDSAMIYGYILYKSIGLIFLGAAAVLGTQYIRDAFHPHLKNIKKNSKNLVKQLKKEKKK